MIAIALLEYLQIANHFLFGYVMTGIGPVLVTIGSLELHRGTVDREQPALDLDLAEAGAGREDFRRGFSRRQSQHRCVEVRSLGGPLGRVGNRNGQRDRGLLPGLEEYDLGLRPGDSLALVGIHLHGQFPRRGRLIAVVADLGGHRQRRIAIAGIQIGPQEKVAHVDLRSVQRVTLRKMPLSRHMSWSSR